MREQSFYLNNLDATLNLARKIARIIVPDFVIALNGDLGVGKTTFTRLLLQALGVRGTIKSPTFTIVEPYQLEQFTLYHFDLYRFNDPEEWFYAGLDEYFSSDSVCIIEWADKALNLIPKIDWEVKLTVDSNYATRIFHIQTHSQSGNVCLNQLI